MKELREALTSKEAIKSFSGKSVTDMLQITWLNATKGEVIAIENSINRILSKRSNAARWKWNKISSPGPKVERNEYIRRKICSFFKDVKYFIISIVKMEQNRKWGKEPIFTFSSSDLLP